MPHRNVQERLNDLFQSGNIREVGRLAGELLARSEGDTGNRRLSMFLASLVYAEANLDERMPVIMALAVMDEKQQPLHIEYCHDREEIAARLGEENRWPELLSLLRSSLLRWQPGTESQADLAWLTKCFYKIKESCRSAKAELNLKLPGGGTLQTGSRGYMNLLLAETMTAGAEAWHRCLRGPGGVNFCLDNLWIFSDQDMANEFMNLLAQDPVAYAALVNEVHEKNQAADNRGKQEMNEGLKNILQPENLLQGIQASELCRAILSKKI